MVWISHSATARRERDRHLRAAQKVAASVSLQQGKPRCHRAYSVGDEKKRQPDGLPFSWAGVSFLPLG
jgi:hypothetical protein